MIYAVVALVGLALAGVVLVWYAGRGLAQALAERDRYREALEEADRVREDRETYDERLQAIARGGGGARPPRTALEWLRGDARPDDPDDTPPADVA